MFAFGFEAVLEGFVIGVAVTCDDGGHVEGGAQMPPASPDRSLPTVRVSR